MRSRFVVVLPERVQLFLSLGEAQEPALTQALVSELNPDSTDGSARSALAAEPAGGPQPSDDVVYVPVGPLRDTAGTPACG